LTTKVTDTVIWIFALVAVALFRIIDSTLDLRIFGHEHVAAVLRAKRPFLVVVWHGRGLLPIFFFQGYPLVVYSSQSRTDRVPTLSRYVRKLTLASLRHLGYQVLDASTFHSESRGVIRFLQHLEHGTGGLIAADGPAGPMFRAKPGAAYAAKRTGVALLPVAAAIRDVVALDSWDRFEIPRPFSKAVLSIGPAIDVPEEIEDSELTNLSVQLESLLNDLTSQAEVEAFAS
jgi:lysophospholipid acyltransferase (LPLAT)-like uncharacterized protein